MKTKHPFWNESFYPKDTRVNFQPVINAVKASRAESNKVRYKDEDSVSHESSGSIDKRGAF